MDFKVYIIGAGPAGLFAAISSARAGAKTVIIEKNTTVGKKLLLTGGGRCNLTHTGAIEDFVRAYGRAGRFLQHCLYEFSPEKTKKFFADLGLRTQVQPDGCVFPVSQRAGEVRDVLVRECERVNVNILYGRRVEKIEKKSSQFIVRCSGESICAHAVIIATGGLSRPGTGSRGDGYRFARDLGHTVIQPRPALVPLVTKEKWVEGLAGMAVDCVRIRAKADKKKVDTAGAMIFTQDGIGGPAAQDLSRFLTDYLPAEKDPIAILVDLLPGKPEQDLERRLFEEFARHPRKTVTIVLSGFLPRRLAEVLNREFGFNGDIIGGQLKRNDRTRLLKVLKGFPLSVVGTRPIEEATVTRGGVSTNEINPKTMQSKICPGLFFAGEVIDVDGPCGGYNLQICWSTAVLAGCSSTEYG